MKKNKIDRNSIRVQRQILKAAYCSKTAGISQLIEKNKKQEQKDTPQQGTEDGK